VEKHPDQIAPNTALQWLAHTRALEKRGEFLLAYDTAMQGLKAFPDDTPLQYRSVLVLARAGASNLACRRYDQYQLQQHNSEDIAALGARLAKDAALGSHGEARQHKALAAAHQYQAIFQRTEGYYPGINAASLHRLAGNVVLAEQLAQTIIRQLDRLPVNRDNTENSAADEEAYYRLATRAEALLILGQSEAAEASLRQAFKVSAGDWAALASTRRQLRLICQVTRQDDRLLGALLSPNVIHYCGHIISPKGSDGRFNADREEEIAGAINQQLCKLGSVIGYGSLAAGADIMIAEALLDLGWELHVALPFCLEEFIEVSVRPSGEHWVERFHHCLRSAQSLRYATEDSYLGDDQLFSYCSGLTMGLAVLRAHYLDAPVSQLAVWDGQAAQQSVGTAYDIHCWAKLSLPQTLIPLPSSYRAPNPPEGVRPQLLRQQRAMLFGDVKGFSGLSDQQLPDFIEQVLGRLARVLDGFGNKISFRNTWGDGVFVVFEDVREAALCALMMQQAMAELRCEDYGLPPALALRLGCHYGPIYHTQDPILKVDNYFGAHVSRTARIEPVTPEGSVYVTEAFAAILALEQEGAPAVDNASDPLDAPLYGTSDDVSPTAPLKSCTDATDQAANLTNRIRFACDYVGRVPAAKGYGDLAMYLLSLHR